MQISIAEAKKVFSSLVNRVVYGKERVILLSRGKPKAALVSIEDLKILESFAQGDDRRQALEEARRLRTELASLTPVAAELEAIRRGRTDEHSRLR